jgi:2-oxoglutarate ferredoxin oxidoreductase subunit beta
MAGLPGVVYSARCAVNTLAQFKRTKKAIKIAFQKQMDGLGYSFVEVLSACPSLLKMTPTKAREWFEMHVVAEFPLGEFKNVNEREIKYQIEM